MEGSNEAPWSEAGAAELEGRQVMFIRERMQICIAYMCEQVVWGTKFGNVYKVSCDTQLIERPDFEGMNPISNRIILS
jgi:hypothetical protein